jgi:histidinol-phosphatase (PHP family)
MPYLIDYHVHSKYSWDGAGSLAEYCTRALEIGIQEICFTNHPETSHGLDIIEAREHFNRCLEEFHYVQQQFPGIKLYFGVEIEFLPESSQIAKIEKFLNYFPFDFRLGSIHEVGDGVISTRHRSRWGHFYQGKNQVQAYARYFEEIKKIVSWGGFDVLGHFDIITRSAFNLFGEFSFIALETQIKEILQLVAQKKLGLEINTSGFHQPCKRSFPPLIILKWAKEMGVKIITIGSDAHAVRELGLGLEQGIKVAREAGYDKIWRIPEIKNFRSL